MNELKPWQNVYVFISSTFNDMHAERDYLVKRVFPELDEWCEERRLRLIDIDLRWGITEKDSMENKRVVEVCLANIDRCRPLFLCFLGQRRGWVPKREDISASTFENFPKLDSYLGSSVTEMEITHALIDPMLNGSVFELRNRERAFFFLRESDYLQEITDPLLRNIYTNEGEPDPVDSDQKLEELKERVRATGKTVFNYNATWKMEATTPELLAPGKPESIMCGRLTDFRCEGHELSDVIIEQLKETITALYPDRRPTGAENPLQRELDDQARFLQFSKEGFIERTGEFDKIESYIENGDVRTCAIIANSGMGKTSYLARLVERLQTADKCNVIYRFIGTSAGSVSQASLLLSIADELSKRFGVNNNTISLQKIIETFPSMLAKAAEKKPLTVIIDAVNQLDTSLDDLSWIPAILPNNVKFIYSFKLGEAAGDALHQKLENDGNTYIIHLKGFEDISDRYALVNRYLSHYLKELDEDNIREIVTSDGAYNPLFLKVILSELRVFGSHIGLHNRISEQFGTTPKTAFESMLKRLENDPIYSAIPSKELTANFFGWLSHSKNGLQPEELAGLMQKFGFSYNEHDARDSVNLMLRQLRAFLAKRDKRQDFFYESFLSAARERYGQPVNGGKSDLQWHRELAEYFCSFDASDKRKVFELAYQYAHAGMNRELVNLLTSFEYMENCIRLFGVENLIDDLSLAELPYASVNSDDRHQLGLIREALQLGANIINKNPDQLIVQLYGRLMGFDLPLIKVLLRNAEQILANRNEPWLKPLCANLPQPGGRISRYYNTLRKDGACLFSDKKRIVLYCSDDKSVKIIEIETGRVLKNFSLNLYSEPTWICLCEAVMVLAVRTFSKLLLLNLTTGQTYDAEGVEGLGFNFTSYDGMVVCNGFSKDIKGETVFITDACTGKLLHSLTFKRGSCMEGLPNSFTATFDNDTGLLYLSTEEPGFWACDPRQSLKPLRYYRNLGNEQMNSASKMSRTYLFEGTLFYVTLTFYDGLNIYDKDSGRVLYHGNQVVTPDAMIDILPDKKILAYITLGRVSIISLESFSITHSFSTGISYNCASSLALSADGSSLYIGETSGEIQIWDICEEKQISACNEVKGRISKICPDIIDNSLIVYTERQLVILKNRDYLIQSGTSILDIQANSLAIAPDGTFAIVSTVEEDGAVYRIDIPLMECRRIVEPSKTHCNRGNVIINCDGRFFGFCIDFNRFEFFDSETGEKVGEFKQVDTRKDGDTHFISINKPQFMPATFSIGPRNLTVLYNQKEYLIMQDPDAPGKERIMQTKANKEYMLHKSKNMVTWYGLLENGRKIAAFYDVKEEIKQDDNDIPVNGVSIFDTTTGNSLECYDDYYTVYVNSNRLDKYPEVQNLVRKNSVSINKGFKEFSNPIKVICRQQECCLYYRIPAYSTQEFEIMDSTKGKRLCRFVSGISYPTDGPYASPDGRYVLIRIFNTLYAFSIENMR